ncbi:unnamed protein product, partial [Choristocarpus tenellus]
QVTAKGNPRDVVHMVEDLLKEGMVEVDKSRGEALVLKELSGNFFKIKDHTSAPIIAKYDSLDRPTQRLVQAAAVIGQEVPLDLLHHLCYCPNNHQGPHKMESRFGSENGRTNSVSESQELSFADEMLERMESQVNTLVRIGFIERITAESMQFLAEYIVTIIYDMILHSRRQYLHKVESWCHVV